MTKGTAPGFSYAFGSGELAALPLVPLNQVFVEYEPITDRTEAYMFAFDPAMHRSLMQDVWAGVPSGPFTVCSTSAGNLLWSLFTSEGYVPQSVGVPSWLTQPPPITFDLSPSFWWSGTPLFPAALPTGQGSVKAARIVDSGQCSHREPLTPILSQVNNTLWTEFIKEVQMEPEPDGAIRHASNAIVYLDHVEGDPTDQRGGFFLSSFFTIVLEEIFTVDIDICFNVEYQLAINGYPFVGDPASTGILSAIPALNHAASVGTNAQDALDALTTALTGRVPLTFLEETTKRQLFPVGVTCTEAPPEVGGTANCSTAAAGFEDNLVIGGPIAGLVEAEIEQLMVTANQAHDLAPQEIPVPWFTGLRNWRCIRDPDTHPEGVGECHYVVRAKRLNVGSNFVELVWFDGKELFNPTYALWVAAQAGSLPGQPNPDLDLLCSWQAAGKAFVAPGFVPRPFGRSELGFTSVPFP